MLKFRTPYKQVFAKEEKNKCKSQARLDECLSCREIMVAFTHGKQLPPSTVYNDYDYAKGERTIDGVEDMSVNPNNTIGLDLDDAVERAKEVRSLDAKRKASERAMNDLVKKQKQKIKQTDNKSDNKSDNKTE